MCEPRAVGSPGSSRSSSRRSSSFAASSSFISQRWLSNAAFGGLESDQAAQYAQRVSIALDYEVRLLANYGSTNSIWSGSYRHRLFRHGARLGAP